MSSVTKKVIIDDIILKLTEANPTDDFTIPRSQISYVLDTVRDKLVGDAVLKDLRQGQHPNAIYIEKEAGKVISAEDDGSTDCAIRHYVTLTKDPIWVTNDKGIVLVQFSNGTKVERIGHSDLDVIKFLSGAKATFTSPVFHREGRKLFIDEVTDIQANEISVHVHYIPTAGYITDETAVYPLDDGLRVSVSDMTVEILKEEIGGTVDDSVDDGNITAE
jgi:hypothetical protein